jgi:hypothetical protein
MVTRTLLFSLTLMFGLLSSGCSDEKYSLDSSIPRLQSPVEKIAYIRTKWLNDKHIETVFFDSRDRALEIFSFGRSSSKLLNRYKGDLMTSSITYYHSDSSEPGYVTIDTLRREFDANGKLISDSHFYGYISESIPSTQIEFVTRYLQYTTKGDTIVKKIEGTGIPYKYIPCTDIRQWERDVNHRIVRYHRLYVMADQVDTVENYTQRFSYHADGRPKMVWYELMYLGSLYIPQGPDTIWYRYNAKNRLVEEEHHYTTDLKNKKVFDETRLTNSEKKSLSLHKKSFFEGTRYFPGNNRTDFVRYKYEKFDPSKHKVLTIPEAN